MNRLIYTIINTDPGGTGFKRLYTFQGGVPREWNNQSAAAFASGAKPGIGAPGLRFPAMQSVYLDGVNDHVLGDSGGGIDNMSAVTFMCQYYAFTDCATLTHNQHLLNKRRVYIALADRTGVAGPGSELYFSHTYGGDNLIRITDVGIEPLTGRWNVVAATWDGGKTMATDTAIYLNGVALTATSAGSQNATGAASDDAAEFLRLGSNHSAGTALWGYMAWAAVWEAELSASQVQTITRAAMPKLAGAQT